MYYSGGKVVSLKCGCMEVKLKYLVNLMPALLPTVTLLISSNLKPHSCEDNYFERHFNFLRN